MVATNIHLMGIYPNEVTAWALFTVPRESIFGYSDPEIVEWDYGKFDGDDVTQAQELARLVREVQSLDFKLGVAMITKAWDGDQDDISPVRLGAMLLLLQRQKQLGDSTITFQSWQLSESVTDERLKRIGLYVADDNIRAATRHAITGLRRANEHPEFAAKLWPYAAEWAARTEQE
jgi:hypothetical protein